MREKVNASVSKTSAGRVHRTRHYRTSHYFSPQPLLRNSLQSSSSPSPGPLLLPAPQLLRVEVPQQPQPPVFCTVPKMSILYALIQIILSSLFIILFLKLADSPRTFSWKHVLSLRYFMKEPNNSTRCVKFQKSFPEIKNQDGLQIRPEFHREGQCVVDKELTICPYDEVLSFPYFYISLFLITPTVTMIFTVFVAIASIKDIQITWLKNFTCLIFMFCHCFVAGFLALISMIFLIPLTRKENEADFMYGRDFMSPPQNISPIWDITQISSQCCGINNYTFWDSDNSSGYYPMSCCDTLLYECKNFPTKDQVWKRGCYDIEFGKFPAEKWIFIFINLIQIVIGIIFVPKLIKID